jgi:hypothetical protein
MLTVANACGKKRPALAVCHAGGDAWTFGIAQGWKVPGLCQCLMGHFLAQPFPGNI